MRHIHKSKKNKKLSLIYSLFRGYTSAKIDNVLFSN